jgi:hypothetical protein
MRRYKTGAHAARAKTSRVRTKSIGAGWGRCKLKSADPQLEMWLVSNPYPRISILVSNRAFQIQPAPLQQVPLLNRVVGAVQLECS